MMFRKLQERINTALGFAESDVQRLVALGFTKEQASDALQQTNGNVDRAAEWLFTNHSPNTTTNHNNHNNPINLTHDDDLQRALQASREEHEKRQQLQHTNPQRNETQQRNNRTAAMNKAAEAAAKRAEASRNYGKKKSTAVNNNTNGNNNNNNQRAVDRPSVATVPAPLTTSQVLRDHHPGVKLVPKLQDKSIEEQILRTANRMKTYPNAVDTIHKALSAIQNNPDNPKFRSIDTNSAGYKRNILNTPGSEDFLRVMKFIPKNTHYLVLDKHFYDPALIYLGISALQQIQLTTEYVQAKQQITFQKEITNILNGKTITDAEEKKRRQEYLSKVPKEPTSSGIVMNIELLPGTTVRRRFDADDTVEDMIHWLVGTYGTILYKKLIISQTWCFVNCNTNPVTIFDINNNNKNLQYTLQYVGFWPSGRLQLQPTDCVVNNNNNTSIEEAPISRGLASGTSSDDE